MKELTLREARQRKGMTQDALAAESGLDQTTISDIETGRNNNPRIQTIKRLAKALGIAPSRLRFAEPKPDSGTVEVSADRVGHSESARWRSA